MGGLQRVAAPSMADMITDMVNTLSCAGDENFQRFWNYDPLHKTYDWWKSNRQTKALIGANKSGKTTSAIVESIAVFTGIIPPALADLYPHKIPLNRPRQVRIIIQDYTKALPELIWPLLVGATRGMLPKMWSQDYDDDQHIFYGPDIVDGRPRTGSQLSIFAVDPAKVNDETKAAKALRGPRIDHTHIVERTTRAVYTESLTRSGGIKDGPCTVTLDYCPQDGKGVWDYKDIYGACYDLNTDERLPEEEQNPAIYALRISLDDNPYVSQGFKDSLYASLKEYELAYRVKGLYSDRAESAFFNMDQLYRWEQEKRCTDGKPYTLVETNIEPEEGIFEGELERASWPCDDEREPVWKIWELPENGEYYLGILDSAEGRLASNFQNFDIVRASQGGKLTPNRPVQVAQLRMRVYPPDLFAIQCLCMCEIYGGCLFVFERNNTCGGIVLGQARYYHNSYKRTVEDREIQDETELLGWYSQRWNKPEALQIFYTMTQDWDTRFEGFCGIRSEYTLADMISFQDKIIQDGNGNTKRVLAAKENSFDDCVSTMFMMAYIVKNQNHLLTPAEINVRGPEESYKSKLEQKAAEGHKKTRFGSLKKQPSLKELAKGRNNRRKHGK